MWHPLMGKSSSNFYPHQNCKEFSLRHWGTLLSLVASLVQCSTTMVLNWRPCHPDIWSALGGDGVEQLQKHWDSETQAQGLPYRLWCHCSHWHNHCNKLVLTQNFRVVTQTQRHAQNYFCFFAALSLSLWRKSYHFQFSAASKIISPLSLFSQCLQIWGWRGKAIKTETVQM